MSDPQLVTSLKCRIRSPHEGQALGGLARELDEVALFYGNSVSLNKLAYSGFVIEIMTNPFPINGGGVQRIISDNPNLLIETIVDSFRSAVVADLNFRIPTEKLDLYCAVARSRITERFNFERPKMTARDLIDLRAKLPTEAREKFDDEKYKDWDALSFAREEYGSWIDRVQLHGPNIIFTWATLKRLDKVLCSSLRYTRNKLRRAGGDLPEWLDLPTVEQANDRQLAALVEGPEETLEWMRIVRMMARRENAPAPG